MKKSESLLLNRGSTLILRAAVVAIGAVVLALCIFALPAMWRSVGEEFPGMTYPIYMIISAMYLSTVPFYIALFQAIKLLGFIDHNKAFSTLSVRALKRIAWCGIAISAVFTVSLPFFYIWADKDDAPGLIIVGMVFVGAAFTVAVFAAVLQRLLREALRIKSENDLTV